MNKKETILYVDDEYNNLILFEACFQNDFNVIVASGAHEAFGILRENGDSIKAVVSDLCMPEINGLEFIEIAKRKYDLPYFIISGYLLNEEIQNALDTELIEYFFKKPYNPEEVIVIIKSYLSEKTPVLA